MSFVVCCLLIFHVCIVCVLLLCVVCCLLLLLQVCGCMLLLSAVDCCSSGIVVGRCLLFVVWRVSFVVWCVCV